MVDEELINRVAHVAVEHEVDPGDYAGGSGHLSFVSFSMKSILTKEISKNEIEINCTYQKEILTEFTIEPFNPPYRSEHEKKISLFLCPTPENTISDSKFSDEEVKSEVTHFIELYLLKIEQTYGDCRAPIKYPPYYHNLKNQLLCFIDLDLGENETIVFSSNHTESMLHRMKEVFKVRFGFEKSHENQME